MVICVHCKKKTGYFNSLSDFSGNYFCNKKCKNDFYKKKDIEKQKDKEMKLKGMIKEIKCKCNQCKYIWYFLETDEKKLKMQARGNALVGVGMCCNPIGIFFSNKSLDLQKELTKMKKCPKCNSTNIYRSPVYHEKRT
jgi:hypothetical protein